MNLGIPRFPQQRANRLEPETALKLEQIMKRNGIITIDNVEHKTEIKDLEDMGELGNGTSGHVVKMKHKLTNKVIAVKVRKIIDCEPHSLFLTSIHSSNRWNVNESNCFV